MSEASVAPQTYWNERLEQLHADALARFGARCILNARPSKSLQGMRVVADRLRKHAGMDAWRLAAEIREELARAPG